MNIYKFVLVLPLINTINSSLVIDGEMSFDVQIIKNNNDKRQTLKVEKEKKKRENENKKYIARKRKSDKKIKEIKHFNSSKQEKIKINASDENGKKTRMRENEERAILKEENNGTTVQIERHITQERKNNGKSRIDEVLSKMMITKAVQLECIYQYPERNQMETLLSDMMNQLTRLIVSAHEYGEGDTSVGNTGVLGHVDNVGDAQVNDARRTEKRFRVVNDRSPAVFEAVFKQLSENYQQFYNTTLQNIDRAKDPCDHQTEIKKIWQDLLAQSQHMLHTSTLLAVEQIFPRNRADDSKHDKMKRMLGKELAKMRPEQLDSLCDNFQLCYNDLLR